MAESQEARCSRGWGARCGASRGPRCRCACGGRNHGNPAARKDAQGELVATELTNPRIFERGWICEDCGKPPQYGDEPQPGECTCNGHIVARDYREFLPGAADQADIMCTRHAAGALVNIPQSFVHHSPTGFEWGYGGSGPADLALNVLGLFVPPPEAYRLHQAFKRHTIAKLPREGGTIRAADVRDWILDYWQAERAEAAHA